MVAQIAQSKSNLESQQRPYWQLFGFKKDPFSLIEKDNSLQFGHWEDYLELVNNTITDNDVLVLVTSDSQQVKSTPVDNVQQKLAHHYDTHRLSMSTDIDPIECLSIIQNKLGIPEESNDDLQGQIDKLLSKTRQKRRPIVLLIEHAQLLPEKTLSLYIKLIKQQRQEESANLKIILFGNPVFEKVLLGLPNDETEKNCVQIVNFKPFNISETANFLKQCITHAGGSSKLPFTREDITFIHQRSHGNISKIKQIARDILIAKIKRPSGQGQEWYRDPITITSLSMIALACVIYTAGLVRNYNLKHSTPAPHSTLYRISEANESAIEEGKQVFQTANTDKTKTEITESASPKVMVYDDEPATRKEALLKETKAYLEQQNTLIIEKHREQVYPDIPTSDLTKIDKNKPFVFANDLRDIKLAGSKVFSLAHTWWPSLPKTTSQHKIIIAHKSVHKLPERPEANKSDQNKLVMLRRAQVLKTVGQYAMNNIEKRFDSDLNRIIDYTSQHKLQKAAQANQPADRLTVVKRLHGVTKISHLVSEKSQKVLQDAIQQSYREAEVIRQQRIQQAKARAELERQAREKAALEEKERLQRIERENARIKAALQREKLAREKALHEKQLREEKLAKIRAQKLAKLKHAREEKLARAKQAKRNKLLAAIRADMQNQQQQQEKVKQVAQPKTIAQRPQPKPSTAPVEAVPQFSQNTRSYDPDSLDSFQDLDEMQPLAEVHSYSNDMDDRIIEVFQKPKPKAKTPVTRTVYKEPVKAKQKHTVIANKAKPIKPHFALQIASVSNPETLKQLVAQYNMKDTRTIKLLRNRKPTYVLVYGDFPNRQIAKSKLKSLPSEIKSLHPWIRDLNDLQSNEIT